MNVAVTAATLDPPIAARGPSTPRMGYVMVFEDMSDLLRAQKQAAWREVARRVAHEIKNPLTPIALSAERIRRHLERGTPPDAASLRIIHKCAETVGARRSIPSERLVDEFALLARFPGLATGADGHQRRRRKCARHVRRQAGWHPPAQESGRRLPPRVLADADAMKRAIANLVDNAAEAMQDALVREIQIATMPWKSAMPWRS